MDKSLERIHRAIEKGRETVAHAHETRKRLRRSTTPGQRGRERDLNEAIVAINDAMEPIRSIIGKATWTPLPENLEAQVRETSAYLQYERRQLKKMRRAE